MRQKQQNQSAASAPTVYLESLISGAIKETSLEAAVQEAEVGDTIRLKVARYVLADALLIEKSLTLKGKGMGKTRIYSEARGWVVRFQGKHNWRAHDISFEHGGVSLADVVQVDGEMIDIKHRSKIDFKHCAFKGGVLKQESASGGSGLYVTGYTQGDIEECEASANDRYGIDVSGHTDLNIEANRCSKNTLGGIAVSQQAKAALERNICHKNKGCGIVYINKAVGKAINNECLDNEVGIGVTDEAHPLLQDNSCYKNTDSNIYDYRDTVTKPALATADKLKALEQDLRFVEHAIRQIQAKAAAINTDAAYAIKVAADYFMDDARDGIDDVVTGITTDPDYAPDGFAAAVLAGKVRDESLTPLPPAEPKVSKAPTTPAPAAKSQKSTTKAKHTKPKA